MSSTDAPCSGKSGTLRTAKPTRRDAMHVARQRGAPPSLGLSAKLRPFPGAPRPSGPVPHGALRRQPRSNARVARTPTPWCRTARTRPRALPRPACAEEDLRAPSFWTFDLRAGRTNSTKFVAPGAAQPIDQRFHRRQPRAGSTRSPGLGGHRAERGDVVIELADTLAEHLYRRLAQIQALRQVEYPPREAARA